MSATTANTTYALSGVYFAVRGEGDARKIERLTYPIIGTYLHEIERVGDDIQYRVLSDIDKSKVYVEENGTIIDVIVYGTYAIMLLSDDSVVYSDSYVYCATVKGGKCDRMLHTSDRACYKLFAYRDSWLEHMNGMDEVRFIGDIRVYRYAHIDIHDGVWFDNIDKEDMNRHVGQDSVDTLDLLVALSRYTSSFYQGTMLVIHDAIYKLLANKLEHSNVMYSGGSSTKASSIRLEVRQTGKSSTGNMYVLTSDVEGGGVFSSIVGQDINVLDRLAISTTYSAGECIMREVFVPVVRDDKEYIVGVRSNGISVYSDGVAITYLDITKLSTSSIYLSVNGGYIQYEDHSSGSRILMRSDYHVMSNTSYLPWHVKKSGYGKLIDAIYIARGSCNAISSYGYTVYGTPYAGEDDKQYLLPKYLLIDNKFLRLREYLGMYYCEVSSRVSKKTGNRYVSDNNDNVTHTLIVDEQGNMYEVEGEFKHDKIEEARVALRKRSLRAKARSIDFTELSAEQMDVRVTLADSINAGNCRVGTARFFERVLSRYGGIEGLVVSTEGGSLEVHVNNEPIHLYDIGLPIGIVIAEELDKLDSLFYAAATEALIREELL